MRSVYLPLLPLPVLAAVVAFSACSSSRTDEPTTRVVPPAVALAAPAPARPSLAPAPLAPADEPSEQEVREFQRPVPK
ncbi:MAG TPA: hypothetical protein VF875_05635 [Anaeromyxobacter sp.]